LVAAARNN